MRRPRVVTCFGILDPADELVAGQRCDVLPGIERRGLGDQRFPEVRWKLVHHPTGHSRGAHRSTVPAVRLCSRGFARSRLVDAGDDLGRTRRLASTDTTHIPPSVLYPPQYRHLLFDATAPRDHITARRPLGATRGGGTCVPTRASALIETSSGAMVEDAPESRQARQHDRGVPNVRPFTGAQPDKAAGSRRRPGSWQPGSCGRDCPQSVIIGCPEGTHEPGRF